MLGQWHWIKLDIGFGTGARNSRMSETIAHVTRPWDGCLNEQVFALPMMMIHGISQK